MHIGSERGFHQCKQKMKLTESAYKIKRFVNTKLLDTEVKFKFIEIKDIRIKLTYIDKKRTPR